MSLLIIGGFDGLRFSPLKTPDSQCVPLAYVVEWYKDVLILIHIVVCKITRFRLVTEG